MDVTTSLTPGDYVKGRATCGVYPYSGKNVPLGREDSFNRRHSFNRKRQIPTHIHD